MMLPAKLRPIEPASRQDRGIDLLVGVGASIIVLIYAGMVGAPEFSLGILLAWPLVFRRSSPQLMFIFATIGALMNLTLDVPTPAVLAVPVTIYAVARWTSGSWGRISVIVGLIGALLGPTRWELANAPTLWIAVITACGALVLTPYLIGRRRAESEEALRRVREAESRALTLRLAESEQRARVAEAEARQRIARELHDIIAHSLSVIVVQSEGGRALAAKRPEQAAETLGTISEISRQALQEMRQLMGVLRNDSRAPADYAPPPGLSEIDALVSRLSDRASFTVLGRLPLHAEQTLTLAVYRIVQEALTNVLRHGGPKARAEGLLDCSDHRQIRVDVTDDGRGAHALSDGNGNGLKGMYERVHMFGGTLITSRNRAVVSWFAQSSRCRTPRLIPPPEPRRPASIPLTPIPFDETNHEHPHDGLSRRVIGEAADGQQTLARLTAKPADVVLMDIRMPALDGVEATKRIVAAGLATKVLILTTFDLDEYVFAALKAGASGFLLKDARPNELLSAIRSVAAGDSVVAPSSTRRLLDHVVPKLPSAPGDSRKRLSVLTDREIVLIAFETGLASR